MIQGSRAMTAAASAAVGDRGVPALPGGYAVTVRRVFPGSSDQVAWVRQTREEYEVKRAEIINSV